MTLDCSRITMSNGQDLLDHRHPCKLCGRHDGAKVICQGCPKSSKYAKNYYHVTCARQAGLQVNVDDAGYHFKCFEHVQCIYVFRAFLEDLKQIEIDRSPNEGSFEPTIPITWDHASHLLNFAVCIMRTLGWAWRWAEWWIKFGDNWEPLVEDLDAVASMTNEELKIVRSTAQTRSVDARNCHLAALGAALRNREYDTEDGGIDQESLERALAHLLDTESLVGPLTNDEIDFFTTWLILAYRSESPLLGFGNDKIPVAAGGSHLNDGSTFPESELGSRPLPGKLESNTVMPQNVAGRKSSGKRKNEDGPVTTALSTSSCEQGCEAGSSKARSVETDSGCKRGSGTRLTTPAAQSGSKSNKNARKACEPKTLVNSTPPLQNQHKKGRRQGAKSAVHESDETIHAQNKTSGTSRQNIPSEQPSPASQQIHHVAFEGSGNDATTTPINGTQAKSLSIGCKFDLLELGKDAFIAINGQDGFNSKVSDLCDLLVAELAYEDNELSNQAFDLLQRYRVEYINKRGHNLYLTNVANFLDKLRLHDSYDSTKLVGFLDKVLEVHYDDINFIDQSFELLANNKVAYERTNALDKYNSKIAGLVDKLLEGEVDHDNDEIMTLKFSLLRRHKTAYVAANGGDSYDINVEAYMRRVI